MRRNRKIWLGLGAFILTTGAVNANDIQQLEPAVEGKINGKAAPSIPFDANHDGPEQCLGPGR